MKLKKVTMDFKCKIRLVEKNDFPSLLEMFHEPDTFKYIKPLANKTDDFYLSFLDLKLKQSQTKEGFYWVIVLETGEIAGAINLTPIPKTEDMQLGWQIKRAWQGKGIASAAAKAALDFALSNTEIDPIYIVFNTQNIASQRIGEKLGFYFLEVFGTEDDPLLKYIYERK